MTARELSQLRNIRCELAEDRARLANLKAVATNTAPSNGGSGGSGAPTDRTAIAASIADLRTEIAKMVETEYQELLRLTKFIDSIDDAYIRRIFKLRFIDGLSWQNVAVRAGTTTDAVKKMCYRFFAKK